MKLTQAIPYPDWSFLYPPRPEKAILPSLIPSFETRGWVSQYKLNGTCTFIGVDPQGGLHTLTRHNTPHKMWKPSERTKALAAFCPRGQWTVFIAELLNDKTPLIKDTLYLFDIIVSSSLQLVGTTFQERQDFLSELMFPKGIQDPKSNWWEKSPEKSHAVVAPGIWLAKTQRTGLRDIFTQIRDAGDKSVEGLVLKDPKGVLEYAYRAGSNQGWQCKCRVALPNSHMGF